MTGTIGPPVERRPLAWRVAHHSGHLRADLGGRCVAQVAARLHSRLQGCHRRSAKHQPAFLKPWFDFWTHLASFYPPVLAYGAVVVETLIAVSLIVGLAGRPMYVVGLFLIDDLAGRVAVRDRQLDRAAPAVVEPDRAHAPRDQVVG